MIRAWYLPERGENQEEIPSVQFLTSEEVKLETGLTCFKVDVENLDATENLRKLKERGYINKDEFEVSRQFTPDYEEKIDPGLREHLHPDEQVRVVLDGEGFFDVRDKNDKWVRIHVGKGDLLILPPKLYHRFTPGKNEYFKMLRVFGEDVECERFYRAARDK